MNPEPQEVNSADLEKLADEEKFWNKLISGVNHWFTGKDDVPAMLVERLMEEYTISKKQASQSKLPVDNGSELLFAFIAEIKKEFADQNWDYLDFIAERVLEMPASQSKLTGTVFVKVSVKDRLPKEVDRYGIILKDSTCIDSSFFDGKSFVDIGHQEVTHWLEETAAPTKLYSEEQMRKCFERGCQAMSDKKVTDLDVAFETYINSLQPKQ